MQEKSPEGTLRSFLQETALLSTIGQNGGKYHTQESLSEQDTQINMSQTVLPTACT